MDVLGRLKKTEELNYNQTVYSTTDYAYNVRDQLTSITQQNDRVRTLQYDGFGRLSSRTTPEQGVTTYSYFKDDTVQTITDARGSTMTFSYNGRHQVGSITYGVPAGVAATANVNIGYDAAGNRDWMDDGPGFVDYVYDQSSRLTSETRSFDGVPGSYTLSYLYNLGDEVKRVTNQSNAIVNYNHDDIGRVTSVTGSGYAGVSNYLTGLSYRAFGAPKQITHGNGKQLSLSYNNRMMLTQWNVPGVLGYSYRYDNYGENNTGRVTFADNVTNGAGRDATLDRSWFYDHVGRLDVAYTGSEARATIGTDTWGHPDGPYAHDYNHDVWGNITSRVGWGGWNAQYTASINNKNQMLTNPANGLSITYDAAGNNTYDGGQAFTYDALGKQVISSWDGLQQNYDGDGLRAKKVMNGVALYYLRSSVLGSQVVAEINASGTWTRGYVYLGQQLVAVQYAGVIWVHQDPVTKGQRLVDINGALVSTIELDPFGGDTNRTVNASFQPRHFTTYERDTVGGMDEAMARRYHGWWSRFSQPDPYDGSYSLTDPQSFNRYSYVQSDPVNLIDPSGLDDIPPIIVPPIIVPIPPANPPIGLTPGVLVIPPGGPGGSYVPGGVGGDPGGTGGGPGGGNPQNSGHEFAHSAVRCPPTGKQLAGNPTVKKTISEAFKRADQFRNERGYWVEHGGWIYQNRRTGRISTFIKTPDTSPPLPRNYPYLDSGYGVYLHSPPTRPGSNIVGVFHIHSENGGPNEYDDAAADNHKAPGVLGTPDGKTYPYGNYQRGIFGEGTPAHCR